MSRSTKNAGPRGTHSPPPAQSSKKNLSSVAMHLCFCWGGHGNRACFLGCCPACPAALSCRPRGRTSQAWEHLTRRPPPQPTLWRSNISFAVGKGLAVAPTPCGATVMLKQLIRQETKTSPHLASGLVGPRWCTSAGTLGQRVCSPWYFRPSTPTHWSRGRSLRMSRQLPEVPPRPQSGGRAQMGSNHLCRSWGVRDGVLGRFAKCAPRLCQTTCVWDVGRA